MANSERINILFVDDEVKILEGLRARLRKQRRVWNMFFISSADSALELLDMGDRIDAVVCDLRMPKMDGACLFKIMKERYPQVVRIMLSGYGESQLIRLGFPYTHRFLAKPCDTKLLIEALNSVCRFVHNVPDERLRSLVGKVTDLQSPLLHVSLENRNDCSQELLINDQGFCAKLLKMVNSAFVRLPKSIGDIDEATKYIGNDSGLIMALQSDNIKELSLTKDVDLLESISRHGRISAIIASGLSVAHHSEAYVSGLMHNIGLLMIWFCGEPADIALLKKDVSRSTVSEEFLLHGVSQSQLGSSLLDLWGLPEIIVEAVRGQYSTHESTALNGIVRESSYLAQEWLCGKIDDTKIITEIGRINHKADSGAIVSDMKKYLQEYACEQ
ncbi:MAG: HDOD domain-containing protein [Planctomycetes bacterium]|nr:HDOD domain-containing protein [Planctomycetota bacterium]